MKKKIILIALLLGFLVFSLIGYNINKLEDKRKKEKYEQIKKDVKEEIVRYANIVHPICKDNSGEILITHNTMVYNGGFDKEKLLDIDEKSYCSVYALVGCDDNEEHTYKIYIKCNEYEDKGFIQWESPFPPKK